MRLDLLRDAVAAARDDRWFPDLGAPHAVARLLWTLPVRPWDVLRRVDPALEPGVDFVVDVGTPIPLGSYARARPALTRPHPKYWSKPGVPRSSAVRSRMSSIVPGVRVASWAINRAAMPATTGDAMLVPDHA